MQNPQPISETKKSPANSQDKAGDDGIRIMPQVNCTRGGMRPLAEGEKRGLTGEE